MIKPPKIFLFYTVLALCVVCISLIYPSDGVYLGHVKLKWPSTDDLFFSLNEVPDTAQTVEAVDSIDFFSQNIDISDTTLLPDSIKHFNDSILLRTVSDSIQYSTFESDSGIVLKYPASFKSKLINFYSELKRAHNSSKVLRVLHMGDSQIEGDRITRNLREKFQSDFGGSGPGFIPLYDPLKQYGSVWINNSGDWKEHLVYKYPRYITDNEYGITGKVVKKTSLDEASVSISRSRGALKHAKNFYSSKLFLKNNSDTINIVSMANKKPFRVDNIAPSKNLEVVDWRFSKSPYRFELKFSGDTSALYLGLALDSIAGIAVDNIAMRGQSTPRLEKNNQALLKTMASDLNIGIIVLQYGTNIAPTKAPNYYFYYVQLLNDLHIIQQTIPNVPVVVVGVGDIAHEVDGKIESLPQIPKIVAAQKHAAFDAGCAFFDLYDTMGGEGSMIKWVQNKPKLAVKDYTHFNKHGGEKVADWIYKAIMSEFNQTVEATNKEVEE